MNTIGSIVQCTNDGVVTFDLKLVIGKNDFTARNMIRDLLCIIKSFLESNGYKLGRKSRNKL